MKQVALLSMALSSALLGGVGIGGEGETDKQRLQGAWQVTSLEMDGEKGPAEAIKGLTYTFKGETLTIAPAEPGSNSEFTVTLDPAKKPKRIELKISKGPGKGKTLPGIYDIKGNGLTICFGDKTRPAEFVSKAKSGVALVVLKQKDTDAVKREWKRLEGTWTVTKMDVEGRSLLEKDKGVARMTVKDGKITSDAQGDEKLDSSTISLDPSQNPKTITIPNFHGGDPKKGITLIGIYELKGNELKVCAQAVETAKLKEREKERPKAFDSKRGVLVILRRGAK